MLNQKKKTLFKIKIKTQLKVPHKMENIIDEQPMTKNRRINRYLTKYLSCDEHDPDGSGIRCWCNEI